MQETLNYHQISREQWRSFFQNGLPPLTDDELQQMKGLNDRISLNDVKEIYIPLTHLIHIYMKEYESLQYSKAAFMQQHPISIPFVIGIAGSVAVGKSTTARLLQMMLTRTFKNKKVQMITTDGFLYPNKILQEKEIMDKKGFPESYDMERLIRFLRDVKSDKKAKVPVYSHQVYDIIPDEFEEITQPDILIVEGINVLQLPANQRIYVSDFFDFSIYVDAQADLNEQWYLERFGVLLDTAFRDPDNYYYQYANGPREAAFKMAKDVWKNVNLKNLNEYILPTRNRADVILHKEKEHLIDTVYLRKY